MRATDHKGVKTSGGKVAARQPEPTNAYQAVVAEDRAKLEAKKARLQGLRMGDDQ